MKSTGIVRKVDDLGRIVIPKELRDNLKIDRKDSLEIFIEGDRIILQAYQVLCCLCNESDALIQYKGKNFCKECRDYFKTS